MLDAFIIEELRRREQEERNRAEQRPVLELPLEDRSLPRPPRRESDDTDKVERGVIVIDI